jgi:hypothetical protein
MGLEQTFDFRLDLCVGLVAHTDGKFAVLLWSSSPKIMWLSAQCGWKRDLDGQYQSH